jgi:mono/diheme cytochrome c family protein
VVPGFERLAATGKAGATAGQLLLSELNCVSCHTTADPSLLRKQAPLLDHVGQRIRVGYLKKFLADPHGVKPGTTMPDLLAGDPDRGRKVEALVHFLASTGSVKHERLAPQSIGPGRDLYHKVGCVACHGSRDAAGAPDKVLPGSVPLGDLKSRYSLPALSAFLENPHQVRPSGRMPRLLNNKEAREVANYLLQGMKFELLAGKGSSRYAYYEGAWDKLPDFATLKPLASGTGSGLDIGVARRGSNYAIKFDAVLPIERDANYTFTLNSDDGSQLWIDGSLVVDNDGIHSLQAKQGKAKLAKGIHQVSVRFFQGPGEAVLEASIEAPGLGRHNLADWLAASEDALKKRPAPKPSDEDTLEIQPSLVEQGRELFGSLGCASCHTLTIAGKPIVSTRKAPALDKLKVGGCLSDKPAADLPAYHLNETQRKALTAALTARPGETTPAAVLTRTLSTFNCYACHTRDKVGGPEEEINRFFQTSQPEMGDEARIPPSLDGVGAKMVPDYLKQLLDKGGHDRPYMHTRMPGFGLANVGPFVSAVEALDKVPAVPPVHFGQPTTRVKADARKLVGGNAFGCIKCHTFAGHKAEGVQGIDMTLIPKRVRRDWFHTYLENPQRIRPGTRMPSAFTDGKSPLPDLGGTSTNQIEAMWVYLQDGTKAQLPVGLQRHSIPLIPSKGAILYRNFIEGAGPRAIGVGYPEKFNLAFDANELRLALLWQGAFIDAARHWTDRGSGFEGPLGDNVLRLPTGAAFSVLTRAEDNWPTQSPRDLGYRFLGYRLSSDDRPTFRYRWNGLLIEDFPNPSGTESNAVLRRTLTLTTEQPLDNLVYRAAAGTKIESLGNGWYRVDDTWKVKVSGGGTPRVRKSAGRTELLVPVAFTDGKAQLIQEYSW